MEVCNIHNRLSSHAHVIVQHYLTPPLENSRFTHLFGVTQFTPLIMQALFCHLSWRGDVHVARVVPKVTAAKWCPWRVNHYFVSLDSIAHTGTHDIRMADSIWQGLDSIWQGRERAVFSVI